MGRIIISDNCAVNETDTELLVEIDNRKSRKEIRLILKIFIPFFIFCIFFIWVFGFFFIVRLTMISPLGLLWGIIFGSILFFIIILIIVIYYHLLGREFIFSFNQPEQKIIVTRNDNPLQTIKEYRLSQIKYLEHVGGGFIAWKYGGSELQDALYLKLINEKSQLIYKGEFTDCEKLGNIIAKFINKVCVYKRRKDRNWVIFHILFYGSACAIGSGLGMIFNIPIGLFILIIILSIMALLSGVVLISYSRKNDEE